MRMPIATCVVAYLLTGVLCAVAEIKLSVMGGNDFDDKDVFLAFIIWPLWLACVTVGGLCWAALELIYWLAKARPRQRERGDCV